MAFYFTSNKQTKLIARTRLEKSSPCRPSDTNSRTRLERISSFSRQKIHKGPHLAGNKRANGCEAARIAEPDWE
jgi:hypothetical protein